MPWRPAAGPQLKDGLMATMANDADRLVWRWNDFDPLEEVLQGAGRQEGRACREGPRGPPGTVETGCLQ